MARRDVSSPSVGEITPGVLLVIHKNLSSLILIFLTISRILVRSAGDFVFSVLERTSTLKYLRIYFEAEPFDKITKDSSAKFTDMLAAIGGTMGLLTGFSIISGIEIIFFIFRSFFNYF